MTAVLPDDVTYEPLTEVLTVGDTKYSLAFLRFFGRHSIGVTFTIIDKDGVLAIERKNPDA
jgi:hypothetical protein